MPQEMKCGGNTIKEGQLSESFANYFDQKVKKIVETCRIDENVYNGRKKIETINDNFMSVEKVKP